LRFRGKAKLDVTPNIIEQADVLKQTAPMPKELREETSPLRVKN